MVNEAKPAQKPKYSTQRLHCSNCTYSSFEIQRFVGNICRNCFRFYFVRGQEQRQALIRLGLIVPREMRKALSPEPKAPVTLSRSFFTEAKAQYIEAKRRLKDYTPLPEIFE